MIFTEAISNPTLVVANLPAIAEIAHSKVCPADACPSGFVCQDCAHVTTPKLLHGGWYYRDHWSDIKFQPKHEERSFFKTCTYV